MKTISTAMQLNTAVLNEHATIREATTLFSSTSRSDLDVIDDEGKFVGVISEGDLIRYAMPNFDQLILGENPSMDKINKLFLEAGEINGSSKIIPLIIYDPITVSPDDEILTAAIIMIEKQIRSLPVLSSTKELLGRITRADICAALLV